jgi:hypothetical protein
MTKSPLLDATLAGVSASFLAQSARADALLGWNQQSVQFVFEVPIAAGVHYQSVAEVRHVARLARRRVGNRARRRCRPVTSRIEKR